MGTNTYSGQSLEEQEEVEKEASPVGKRVHFTIPIDVKEKPKAKWSLKTFFKNFFKAW